MFVCRFSLFSVILISLAACNATNTRLEQAQDAHPLNKINKKITDDLRDLESTDAKTRAWAAYNIGKASGVNYKAVPYLVAILSDTEETTLDRYVGNNFVNSFATTPADEAVKALVKIGKPALDPLIKALDSKNLVVQQKAIKALGLIRENQAIKPLVVKLGVSEPEIRLAAASALGKFRGPWVADALLSALSDSSAATRASAAYALGYIRDPAAFKPLVKHLADDDVNVQSQVAIAISKYGYDAAIPVFIEALNESNKIDKPELIYNMGTLRDYRIIETLIPLVEENDKAIRAAAVASLRQISGQIIGADRQQWQRWWKNKVERTRNTVRQ